MTIATTPSQLAISDVCEELRQLLISKNARYGDSALDPLRILSGADAREQIKVRIDDKLSRIVRGGEEGEDVLLDLAGYIVLLLVLMRREAGAEFTLDKERPFADRCYDCGPEDCCLPERRGTVTHPPRPLVGGAQPASPTIASAVRDLKARAHYPTPHSTVSELARVHALLDEDDAAAFAARRMSPPQDASHAYAERVRPARDPRRTEE